jgi:hypothetical protein
MPQAATPRATRGPALVAGDYAARIARAQVLSPPQRIQKGTTLPILANLDMEYTHAAATLRQPPAATLAALRARWANILKLLPEHDQPGLIAWGVTDEVLRLAPDQPWPAPATAALANSKATSHAVEVALGSALPHSALLRDEAGLLSAIAAMPHRWVLKHPMGVSGRERVRGDAHTIDQPALGWARRMWATADTPLVLEPWVEQAQERSLHYHIPPDGPPRWLGWATLLTDRTGTLRGLAISPDHQDAPPWEPITRAAVARIAAMGYHGPISVDTMTGLLGDQAVVRPVTEINARHTFGRMALELLRHTPPGAALTWLHPTAKEPLPLPPEALTPEVAVPGTYRLPELADPGGASGTVIVLARG